METQNITLSLPKSTLRKIKVLAARRQISVSHLMSELLEQAVNEDSGYAAARRRQLDLLTRGLDLGLGTAQPSGREELHERDA